MTIPFLELAEQFRKIRPDILKEVRSVFDTQNFVLKNQVDRFEKTACKFLGSECAIGLASGTDALFIALAALGVGPGDEVITTPFSFFATAGAVSRTGATPVFSDIDRSTFNLDPEKIKKKITRRTKVILPVHLFGLPCDMDAINTLASKHSLFVVEDAAQSFGATHKGRQSGTVGDVGCFSFYPTKNLGGAGDGGMVVTGSKELAAKMRILRDHGQTKKYIHEFLGINSRLDELQAAVLNVKIKHIHVWNQKRREHARAYNKAFAGLPLQLPGDTSYGRSIYHLYSVLTDRRQALADHLAKQGIGHGIYYPLPLHLQPCYQSLGYRSGDLPVVEEVSKMILSLPMYPELPLSDRAKVIKAVRAFFGKK